MIKEIIESIKEYRENPYLIKEIKRYEPVEKKNELVFFIKPEILGETVELEKILEMIFNKMKEFSVEVESISILGGEYLQKYDIMAKHYGVINKIAREGKDAISQQAKEKFKEIFGEDIENVEIYGAFQFLEKYPEFTPFTLNILWENNENKKLASGTYCEKIRIGEKYVYVLNGFHPYQLLYFTEKSKFLVVFAVSSDTSWKDLRRKFIGATNPKEADEGSIRRILLEHKEEYGIPVISQGYNGVHLSAGPVEGLVELLRFGGNYEKGEKLKISDTVIGRKFLEHFSEESVEKMMGNPKVNGETVFDLTEEMDTNDAIEILSKYFK